MSVWIGIITCLSLSAHIAWIWQLSESPTGIQCSPWRCLPRGMWGAVSEGGGNAFQRVFPPLLKGFYRLCQSTLTALWSTSLYTAVVCCTALWCPYPGFMLTVKNLWCKCATFLLLINCYCFTDEDPVLLFVCCLSSWDLPGLVLANCRTSGIWNWPVIYNTYPFDWFWGNWTL